MANVQKKLSELLSAQYCPSMPKTVRSQTDWQPDSLYVVTMFSNVLKMFFTRSVEYENKVETNDKAGGTYDRRNSSRR
jgi:hypothetical protein